MMPLQTTYRPRGPLDLRASVGSLQRGPRDPTQQHAAGVIWRATRTAEGVATLALAQQSDGSVRAAAWGPGRGSALAQVPALCGALDDARQFDASLHPVVAHAHRRNPGLRLARTGAVFDAFAQAVIEQKVTVAQAFSAWRRLVTWRGERAPGPTRSPLRAAPPPEVWRRIPSWEWHRAGLEPPQAKTLAAAAARAEAVERPASDRGRRPRPASARWAIPMTSASATCTSRTTSAMPSPAAASTTTECSTSSRPGTASVSG